MKQFLFLTFTFFTTITYANSWDLIAASDKECVQEVNFYITEGTPFGLLEADGRKIGLTNKPSPISSAKYMVFEQISLYHLPSYKVLIPYDWDGEAAPLLKIYYSGVIKTCVLSKEVSLRRLNVGSVGH